MEYEVWETVARERVAEMASDLVRKLTKLTSKEKVNSAKALRLSIFNINI